MKPVVSKAAKTLLVNVRINKEGRLRPTAKVSE